MTPVEITIACILGLAIGYGVYRYISSRKSKPRSGGGYGGGGPKNPPTQQQ